MRAKLSWRTKIPTAHLPVVLEILGWMPAESQDSATVTSHRERILKDLPPDKQKGAESGHLMTIRRARTDSWGIVCRDQPDLLTIRIDGSDTTDVHKAAEDLIDSLVFDLPKHWRVPEHDFHLVGNIEILEKHGETLLHEGRFVRGRFRRTLHERGLEIVTFGVLILLAAICFYRSMPPDSVDLTSPAMQHLRWKLDLYGRLGTAFLATAVTTLLYIAFTLFEVQRHRRVVWSPPKRS